MGGATIHTCIQGNNSLNATMPKLKIPDIKLQIDIPGLNLTKGSAIKCTEQNGKKICNFPWIGEYIAGVYQYAIGIVGILAAVVLMIGGVMWIVAGGSAIMIGEAKSWIGASLTGLVIALCSYLILYQVNPTLTVFGPLKIAQVEKAPEAGPSVTSTSQACQTYKETIGSFSFINFSSIPRSDQTALPSSCSAYNTAFDSFGAQAKYLKALAATESACNPSAQSPAGACGLMQLMPDTAKIYNSNATCQWLKDHPQESITIASQYINANAGAHGGNTAKISAGYNSGYSTSPNPITGKKGGLVPSSDCPGYKAFECCILPGELVETQDHAYRTIKYLNSQLQP